MASKNDPKSSPTPENANAELQAQIEDLINSLSNKFAGVSSEIFAKMDDMSRRLDNLEAKLAQQTDIPVARPKSEKSDN